MASSLQLWGYAKQLQNGTNFQVFTRQMYVLLLKLLSANNPASFRGGFAPKNG